ncbi:glutathione S-transferase family protein [Sphingomonas sp. CL5.1]|uniref:glutathione S-transferase family protein n=1 Tax=Sphingomonas sp. CL5.1 TaxID=2653203 RepID=UPI001583C6D5|nr:glutathione S-transferase family protein [Sphingomonas sp. CL5.1]QKR99693.1 glutathione S-transferase family protein [Sphingomonas sp. CL5.1]
MDLTLYFFPGACSRVTMTALEGTGVRYRDRLVNIRADEQKSADYARVNPKGKVPALAIDGRIMTENVAILVFLDRLFPTAGLLPHDSDPVSDIAPLSDLLWCSSTLHPAMRQIRAPDKYTVGDPADVKADGMRKFAAECARIAAGVDGRWWYGERWSIVDVYLFWLCNVAQKGGFPLADYPAITDHAARVRQLAPLQRALERERAGAEAHGLTDIVY